MSDEGVCSGNVQSRSILPLGNMEGCCEVKKGCPVSFSSLLLSSHCHQSLKTNVLVTAEEFCPAETSLCSGVVPGILCVCAVGGVCASHSPPAPGIFSLMNTFFTVSAFLPRPPTQEMPQGYVNSPLPPDVCGLSLPRAKV